ncbi:hypothetical protein CC79DRAFT_1374015 [Sarocladium strictum]
MKLLPVLSLLGLSRLSGATENSQDHLSNDHYVLQLERGVEPQLIATRLGLVYERALQGLADHHIFRSAKSEDDHVKAAIKERKLRKRGLNDDDPIDGIRFSEKQRLRKLEKRAPPPSSHSLQRRQSWDDESWDDEPIDDLFGTGEARQKQLDVIDDMSIKDPLFEFQWHLLNTDYAGNDVNVTEVWRQGITGRNVTVALMDDGIDMFSKDLKDNYFAEGSYDYNDDDSQPKPELSDDTHGTRGAGVVAAAKNDVCGLGVAYNAKLSGIRILSGPLFEDTIAEAMMYKNQLNDIYSCSWGPPDDGETMAGPGLVEQRAMQEGVRSGRGGLGSVYVFASGNGGRYGDDCNFDGYANSIYSITIGAVDYTGHQPYYAESCSANLAVSYSSGSGEYIYTTDVGTSKCSSSYGGTSAAAPLAAGVFALALSVRPELSWRDIQYLTLLSAVQPEDTSVEWQTTAIGRNFSHAFGYGSIDAWSLVEMAKEWEPVKPQELFAYPVQKPNKAIPQGDTGLITKFEITKDDLKKANLERVEHVTVTMNLEHTRRGDVSVELVSPQNVTSYLATGRELDTSQFGFYDWTFMSVAHWGESGVGTWTLTVKDTEVNRNTGKLIDCDLKLWGEAIEAEGAKKPPVPGEEDSQDDPEDEAEDDDDSAAPSSARVSLVVLFSVIALCLLR